MLCPICQHKTKTLDSRMKGIKVKRRRECPKCLTRFTTYERIEVDSLPEYLKEKAMNL